MNDFVSTSHLQQLEDSIVRIGRRSPFYAVLAFMTIPITAALIVAGYYWWDQEHPVVVDFKVQTQFPTPAGVMIDGTVNKVRDCEVIEVSARTVQREVKSVEFLDLRSDTTPAFSRPLGPQKWGPWLIWAPDGEGVTIFVRHRCNPLWTHSDELTSFVVGKQ